MAKKPKKKMNEEPDDADQRMKDILDMAAKWKKIREFYAAREAAGKSSATKKAKTKK